MAWSNIVYICFILLMIPTSGFAEATISLVSGAVGRKEPQAVVGIVKKAVAAAYCVTVPVALLAALWPEVAASIFTSNQGVIDGASGSVRLVALAILIVLPAETWAAALVGVGDTSAASVVEISLTGVMLLWAFLSALVWDGSVVLVWMGIPLGWAAVFIMARAWMDSNRWQRVQV